MRLLISHSFFHLSFVRVFLFTGSSKKAEAQKDEQHDEGL